MTGSIDSVWIAEYDQRRAVVDESLDGLVKIAQRGPESPTMAFLAVMGTVCGMNADPGVLAAILAAAVTRLAKASPP